jgi:transcriptional regulator GlxA family with amidase domain
MSVELVKNGSGKLKIGFILSRSFTLSAFALFVDTLRLASDERDRSGRVAADWQVLGNDGHFVKSSCGVQVSTTSSFGDPTRFDYIVVVGGLLDVPNPVDNETIRFLRKADAMSVPLIGLCTGTFILADAGLMAGHQCCISWLHQAEFRERFPDQHLRHDRLFNLDRRRGSCVGGSTSADIAASIVRQHIGRDAERNALEVLHIEKARSPDDLQTRRPLQIETKEPRVRAALLIMERNVETPLSVSRLADSVGISRRQLERLFFSELHMPPARAHKMLRLSHAKRLLEHTRAPLIEIAVAVGFETASHFARTFKINFGESPTTMRQRKWSGSCDTHLVPQEMEKMRGRA